MPENITLESFLRKYTDKTPDFQLRVGFDEEDVLRFYIHPLNVSGATPTFSLKGNNLELVDFPVSQES